MFESSFYDVRVVEVTADNHLVLDYQGETRKIRLERGQQPVPGNIGRVLCVDRLLEAYVFKPYADQSLRRKPELDRSTKTNAQQTRLGIYGGEWGWRNNRFPKGFRAPVTVIPGADGGFLPIQCELLRLDVPKEFTSFCEQYGCTPESMLKSFIADALKLDSSRDKPRADGYDRHCSFAFGAVQTYLDQAHGWRKELAQ